MQMKASVPDLRSNQRSKVHRPIREGGAVGHRAPASGRLEAKRNLIIDAAMRHFAEQGYHAARIEDLSMQLGVAKGSIFHYFGSTGGLFVDANKPAVRSFSKYLDCPANVRDGGFFEILRYWLVNAEHMLREDWIP